MKQHRLFGLVCFVSTLWIPAVGAEPTPPPTNKKLISCMPRGLESVMIARIDVLKGEKSLLREFYAHRERIDSKDISEIAFNLIHDADLLLMAWGGSDFGLPKDTGSTGKYLQSAIYYTARPLDALKRTLSNSDSLKGFKSKHQYKEWDVLEIETWSNAQPGSAHVGKPEFLAVVDERCAVTSPSLEQIRYILDAIRDGGRDIPEQWRAPVEAMAIESPLVVIRRYAPEAWDENPLRALYYPPKAAAPEWLALSLLDVEKGTISLTAAARDRDAVQHWYREYFDHCYLWNLKADEGRLGATLEPTDLNCFKNGFVLLAIVLYGPCIMI